MIREGQSYHHIPSEDSILLRMKHDSQSKTLLHRLSKIRFRPHETLIICLSIPTNMPKSQRGLSINKKHIISSSGQSSSPCVAAPRLLWYSFTFHVSQFDPNSCSGMMNLLHTTSHTLASKLQFWRPIHPQYLVSSFLSSRMVFLLTLPHNKE